MTAQAQKTVFLSVCESERQSRTFSGGGPQVAFYIIRLLVVSETREKTELLLNSIWKKMIVCPTAITKHVCVCVCVCVCVWACLTSNNICASYRYSINFPFFSWHIQAFNKQMMPSLITKHTLNYSAVKSTPLSVISKIKLIKAPSASRSPEVLNVPWQAAAAADGHRKSTVLQCGDRK